MEKLRRLFKHPEKDCDDHTISEAEKVTLHTDFRNWLGQLNIQGVESVQGDLYLLDTYTYELISKKVTRANIKLRLTTPVIGEQPFISRARLGHSYYQRDDWAVHQARTKYRLTSVYKAVASAAHAFCQTHKIELDAEDELEFLYAFPESGNPEVDMNISVPVTGFTIMLSGVIKL